MAFTDTWEIPLPDFSFFLLFLVTTGHKYMIVSDAAQQDESLDAGQEGQASWVMWSRGRRGR